MSKDIDKFDVYEYLNAEISPCWIEKRGWTAYSALIFPAHFSPSPLRIEYLGLESFLGKSERIDSIYGVVGILFADYTQIEVKEYIAADLMLYDSLSADYIDFFLPGYTYESEYNNTTCRVNNASLNGKELYFDKDGFDRCVLEYRRNFGLEYLGKPVLVLHEVKYDYISPERIVLELDYKEIKTLFDSIITIAKEHTDIGDYSAFLQKKYIFCMFPKLLKMLISTFIIDIDEVESVSKEAIRFRIRNKIKQ